MKLVLSPLCALSVFASHVLRRQGVEVLGFYDKKTVLHGKFCTGLKIFNADEIHTLSSSATVVFCSTDGRTERVTALNTECFHNASYLNMGFMKDNSVNHVLQLMQDIDWSTLIELIPTEHLAIHSLPYEVKRETLANGLRTDDEIVLRSTEFVVTERCTLRCKHCANLFQYYTNPEEYDQADICNSVNLFMSKIDFVRLIIVTGGEVFTYGDKLSEILLQIYEYKKKYGTLMLITNGTRVPSKKLLNVIKATGGHVKISDYGTLSSRKDQLVNSLNAWNIPFEIADVTWYDMHKLDIDNGDNTQSVFESCNTKFGCATVLKTKWYYCEFIANAENLKAIPIDHCNSFDLMDESLTKNDLRDFINRVQTPPGCRYCSGGLHGAIVKAGAEQLSAPLFYKRLADR